MHPEHLAGITVALCGVPVLIFLVKRLGSDPLRLATRLMMWLMAASVLWLAQIGSPDWAAQLGLNKPSATTVLHTCAGTLIALIGWPIIQFAQRALSGNVVVNTEPFQKLVAIPLAYRSFLILTAGVTEEILFRGYAIGVGSDLLQSVWLAFTLSLLAFVGSHFRWGVSHLAYVTWAGLVLSILFVVSSDLLACMITHTLIDTVGLVLAPWGMAMKGSPLKTTPKSVKPR